MSADSAFAATPNDSHYILLTDEERQVQINKLLSTWSDFVAINDISLTEEDVFINQRMLFEVVERVSKRKYYFEVFHSLGHISEFKEVALSVFWINKLKPFTVTKENSPLCASVNELFSVHMIMSVFEKVRKEKNVSAFSYPSQAVLRDFVYALKYQDMTKESLIIYIEVLATACGLPVFDSVPAFKDETKKHGEE